MVPAPAGGIRDRASHQHEAVALPTKSWHSVLELIREAKVQATEPGGDTNQISTFTNKRSDRVVSLYNKSWVMACANMGNAKVELLGERRVDQGN